VRFAFLLAALAEVPDPRRAQGRRYSMRHLLLFSGVVQNPPFLGYTRRAETACE